MTNSWEDKAGRRQWDKSPVSAVNISRVVKAVGVAGRPISSLEVRPDGTIVPGIIGPTNDDGEEVFAKCADSLPSRGFGVLRGLLKFGVERGLRVSMSP